MGVKNRPREIKSLRLPYLCVSASVPWGWALFFSISLRLRRRVPAALATKDIFCCPAAGGGAMTSRVNGAVRGLGAHYLAVCLLLALFLCVKHIHGKQATDVVTGRERVDWGRVLFGAGIWAMISILAFAVTFLLKEPSELVFQFEPSKFFVMLVISLLLFPLQTSCEEVLFRGYLMQWTYILFRNKWTAVILTGVLFGLLHSANTEVAAFGAWIALPQYILMGLILGYVAVADNGMELSLGLHAANNILAAVTCTSGSTTLQTHALFRDLNPTSSWTDILSMLIAGAVFIWICNRKYRFIR